MGSQSAVYSWPTVKALLRIVLSMNLAGFIALVLAALWAVRLDRGFGEYLNLVTAGDGRLWSTLILVSVLLCLPSYVLGLKSYVALRNPSTNEIEENTDGLPLNRLLFSHALACVISGILVAVLNVACLVRPSGFQQKDRDGLTEAIENYGGEEAAKRRVDTVQVNLECCGGESYRDWFRVPWLRPETEETADGPRMEGQSMSETPEDGSSSTVDVPFSCCSNEILRPCVHHDILNPSSVYEYDPKRLAIATVGCRSKIVDRARIVKRHLIAYLLLLSVYQIVLSLLARLLQTAHSNEMYIGTEKSRYNVWIFARPSDRRNEALLRRETADERRGSVQTLISTQFTDDETVRTVDRRKRKGLRRFGSRISSLKSRSLPLVGSSVRFSLSKSRSDRETDSSRRFEDRDDYSRYSDDKVVKDIADVKKRPNVLPKSYAEEEHELESPTTLDPLPPIPTSASFQATLEIPKIRSRASLKLLSKSSNEKNLVNVSQPSPSGGNRRKVLARFDELSESKERIRESREEGGAEASDERRSHPSFDSTDLYDRFRGTLQHTLARREPVGFRPKRGMKSSSRVYGPRIRSNVDPRRGNLLAKLRCNDVTPSYRLLANFEIPRRVVSGLHSSAPPPPPPPPPPENPWTRDFSRTSWTEPTEGRCSVCNPRSLDSATLPRREMEDARVRLTDLAEYRFALD